MDIRRTSLYIVFGIVLIFLGFAPMKADTHEESRKLFKEAKELMDKSDYNNALVKLLNCVQIEEKYEKPDTVNLLNTYYYVGGIYTLYSNFAQALDVYEKGYNLSVEAGMAKFQFMFLNNMIGAGCQINETSQADELNEKVRLIKGIREDSLAFYYYFNKGFIAGAHNDTDGKIKWMKEAINVVDKYGMNGSMKIYPYSEIYQCYEKQGELQQALKYLMQYDSLAHAKGEAYLYVDCYKGLMRIYTKMGNKEKALYYQNEFFRYNDSLLNVNEFSQIKNKHQVYENQQKIQTIDSQHKTIALQKAVLIILILLIVITVGAVIIIWRQQRIQNSTNKALFARNNELMEIERKYMEILERKNMEREDDASNPQDDATGQTNGELLHKIMEVMSDEDVFCNPEFSLAMLAKLTDSNTNYVSQTINSTHGKNFRTFVNEYRIKVAMKRMQDEANYGNYSIQGIAESVGFKAASNFISAFKKMTGMTPSLYQKLSKSSENG